MNFIDVIVCFYTVCFSRDYCVISLWQFEGSPVVIDQCMSQQVFSVGAVTANCKRNLLGINWQIVGERMPYYSTVVRCCYSWDDWWLQVPFSNIREYFVQSWMSSGVRMNHLLQRIFTQRVSVQSVEITEKHNACVRVRLQDGVKAFDNVVVHRRTCQSWRMINTANCYVQYSSRYDWSTSAQEPKDLRLWHFQWL